MPQKSNNNEGVSREKVKNIGADYGYAAERVREVLQSVGIRPKDLSRINFAAELKSRVGGNADVDAGSGERGEKWGTTEVCLAAERIKEESSKMGACQVGRREKSPRVCKRRQDIPA